MNIQRGINKIHKKKKIKVNHLFVFLFFITYFLNLNSLNTTALLKIIKEDDIETLQAAIVTGFNPNTYFIRPFPFISCALTMGAQKITGLLLEEGTNINALYTIGKWQYSPLYDAFVSNKCSIELCQKLILSGADIWRIKIKNKSLNKIEKIYTIFDLLIDKRINFQKKQFIAEFSIKRFDKLLLEVAFSKGTSLASIVFLVENGAYISENIIEVAKKYNVNKSIIYFLQYQTDIKKVLINKLSFMPTPIINIINEYTYGIKQGMNIIDKKDLNLQLIMSIKDNDFFFIEYYLRSGGNPNFIVNKEDGKYPLLLLAICYERENMANLLLKYGADVNLQGIERGTRCISSLLVSFLKKGISLSFIKQLLNKGADINNLGSTNIQYNLTLVLNIKWHYSNEIEKTKFIIDYLLKLYGNRVLEFIVSDKNANIDMIKFFIQVGATCDEQILKRAIKMKASASIINYLRAILQLDEKLTKSNFELPFSVIDTINDYQNDDIIVNKTPREETKCIIT